MAFYSPCVLLVGNITHSNLSRLSRSICSLRSPNWGSRGKFLFRDRWLNNRGFRDRRSQNKFGPTPYEPPIEGPLPSFKALGRPFLFTVGFSTSAFVGCSIWQYENIRARARQKPISWLPETKKVGAWRQYVNDFWNNLSEADKLFAPIFLANVLVFLAWRVPKFQPTMLAYFASNPASKVICWPMLLSTFSHYSLFHLGANMYVFHSFCPGIVNSLGKEQTLALYLSAGVIASFTSFLYKVATKQPGMSVGASGAIMAVLGFICSQYPDARLSIILLPMFTFTAGAAIKVALGVDFLGVAFGWRFFDHAAHLGGALTGIFWAYFGNALIWRKREPIIRQWHEIRKNMD